MKQTISQSINESIKTHQLTNRSTDLWIKPRIKINSPAKSLQSLTRLRQIDDNPITCPNVWGYVGSPLLVSEGLRLVLSPSRLFQPNVSNEQDRIPRTPQGAPEGPRRTAGGRFPRRGHRRQHFAICAWNYARKIIRICLIMPDRLNRFKEPKQIPYYFQVVCTKITGTVVIGTFQLARLRSDDNMLGSENGLNLFFRSGGKKTGPIRSRNKASSHRTDHWSPLHHLHLSRQIYSWSVPM